MISIQTFYKSYQFHHHRTKAIVLKKLLDNNEFIKAEDIIEPIWGFEQTDYERTLRIEMRANLFHAIETLFALYFCLQPDKNGKVDDLGLFRNLNKKHFYYDKIRKIANEGKESLKILNTIVKFGDEDVQLGRYLFYYAFKKEKFPPGLEESIDAIKDGLYLLATELSDTAEYNSYKHSLRSIPAFLELAFEKAGTKEIVMSFDAKNSMTYFIDLEGNGFSFVTKVFDTERDYKMTLLASNLIYNIMMFRRASIVRDMPGIPLAYFGKENVASCGDRSKEAYHFINSFTPVKRK